MLVEVIFVGDKFKFQRFWGGGENTRGKGFDNFESQFGGDFTQFSEPSGKFHVLERLSKPFRIG